jgi:hypothetical protein
VLRSATNEGCPESPPCLKEDGRERDERCPMVEFSLDDERHRWCTGLSRPILTHVMTQPCGQCLVGV